MTASEVAQMRSTVRPDCECGHPFRRHNPVRDWDWSWPCSEGRSCGCQRYRSAA